MANIKYDENEVFKDEEFKFEEFIITRSQNLLHRDEIISKIEENTVIDMGHVHSKQVVITALLLSSFSFARQEYFAVLDKVLKHRKDDSCFTKNIPQTIQTALEIAMLCCPPQALDILLKNGADKVFGNEKYMNKLICCSYTGDKETIKQHFDKNKSDYPSNIYDDFSNSLLHYAAANNQLELIKYLLKIDEERKPANKKNKANYLPLQIAIIKGSYDVAKYLIDIKYNSLEDKSYSGITSILCAFHYCNLDSAKWILSNYDVDLSVKTKSGLNCLLLSAEVGEIESVKFLLENYPKYFTETDQSNGDKSVMSFAASSGNCELIKYLVVERQCDVNKPSDITPLLTASYNGYLEVIRFFLEKTDAEANCCDEQGWSVLLWSAYYNHVDCLEYLLEKYPTIPKVSNDGTTMLLAACSKNSLEVITWLLDKGYGTLDESDTAGWTPFIWACYCGTLRTVKYLLAKGASVTERTTAGSSPFIQAALQGKMETVKFLLLEAGSTIDESNTHGFNALLSACSNDHVDVAKWLLEQGAVNELVDNNSPILTAASYDCTETTKWLYSIGSNVEDVNESGWTSLAWAVCNGNLDLTKWLITEAKANPQCRTNKGNTPLLIGCENGKTEIVKWLLESKSSTLAESNNSGWTALIWAASKGHLDIVKLLIDTHNATVSESTAVGTSPISMAAFNGHTTTVEYLLTKGASIHEKNKYNFTPLLSAAKNGYTDTMQWILENCKDADINCITTDNNDCLLIAIINKRIETARWLISKTDINLYASNKSSKNAVKLAHVKDILEILDCLLDNFYLCTITDLQYLFSFCLFDHVKKAMQSTAFVSAFSIFIEDIVNLLLVSNHFTFRLKNNTNIPIISAEQDNNNDNSNNEIDTINNNNNNNSELCWLPQEIIILLLNTLWKICYYEQLYIFVDQYSAQITPHFNINVTKDLFKFNSVYHLHSITKVFKLATHARFKSSIKRLVSIDKSVEPCISNYFKDTVLLADKNNDATNKDNDSNDNNNNNKDNNDIDNNDITKKTTTTTTDNNDTNKKSACILQ